MSADTKIIGGITVATLVILVGGVFLVSRQSSQEASIPDAEIVSRNGLHWHPELSVYVKGEKQEIPKDLGIGAVHKPMHTHDTSGTIHMEMNGLVTKEETKLGNFFKIWGKAFNFGGQNIKMLANGQENTEFGSYLMKDGDKLEIRYE